MFFPAKPKRVLIVDDDPSLLRQLRVRLEKRDRLKVEVATNGVQALEKAFDQAFDLIVLDWILPDTQGIELLKTLKANAHTRHTPVLMLTGCNKIGEVEQAFRLGASAYLTKPCELAKFGAKVRGLLAA